MVNNMIAYDFSDIFTVILPSSSSPVFIPSLKSLLLLFHLCPVILDHLFTWLWILSSLYIVGISPLSDILAVSILWAFTSLTCFLSCTETFYFSESHLSGFHFNVLVNEVLFRMPFPIPISCGLLHIFSSISFSVLDFKCFTWICLQDHVYRSNFTLLYLNIQFSQHPVFLNIACFVSFSNIKWPWPWTFVYF